MATKSEKKLKTVITASGDEVFHKDCVLLQGQYYVRDKEAVLINKKWFLLSDKNVKYDWETQSYFHLLLSKQTMRSGVVALDSDKNLVEGYFSENPYKNCLIQYISGGKTIQKPCINYEIPRSLDYVEHINDSLWASPECFKSSVKEDLLMAFIPARRLGKTMDILKGDEHIFKTPASFTYDQNAYSIEESKNFNKIKDVYAKFNPTIPISVRRASKLLGDMTFGAELECKLGTIPDNILNQLGVIICRDGSINYSPEFVTVPYSGAKGLHSLNNLFKEGAKRCTTDYNCSLHYHFGNIRTDREFLVALYKLYGFIQYDLHEMLPYYKTDPNGIKKKNYCMMIPPNKVDVTYSTALNYKDRVSKAFSKIQSWAQEIKPGKDFNRKIRIHPKSDRKWNWENRYFSVNFMNMFISKRNTIEFRSHHSVLNNVKGINWFFICAAIIKYAENNSAKIINSQNGISLKEVVDFYGTHFKTEYAKSVSEYLNAYIDSRKKYFKNKRDNGDKIAKEDYQKNDYSFSHGDFKLSLI